MKSTKRKPAKTKWALRPRRPIVINGPATIYTSDKTTLTIISESSVRRVKE